MITLQSETYKYSVSHIASHVASVGLARFVESRNSYHIPNQGIPNVLASQNFGTTQIDSLEIPSKGEAVELYRRPGGRLIDPHPFAVDPLNACPLRFH